MPISYEIDHERRLVLSWATGLVNDADVMAHSDSLRAGPEYDPEYAQLSNFSKADVSQVSAEVIQRQAARPHFFSPKSRRAMVVATPRGAGLSRIFAQPLGGSVGELRVFYLLEDAKKWLGLEPSSSSQDAPDQTTTE